MIARSACFGAWLLGLLFLGLGVVGLIRWPHWVWAAPIACAVLALAATYRLRHLGGTILLGVLTLVLLAGAGALTHVAVGVARPVF
ncbi:hypothetical protein SK571_36105 [Lentzea sp. BCCO 10_0798]|uniref:MYXO-CTERM domain-containing protein n=1 Tax=Lentzea kristufekii TaxID=3095430 RepID=A0ABU4U3H3_9PSEU|nr:hypothetical protein [Lentzea sp. BCCO 10_0798]MDX8054824.1 hypothetical protein [Lentzea sp. BCCO 10_0798]